VVKINYYVGGKRMLKSVELAKILRSNGCKVTPQRLAVYDAFAKSKEHPTAEAVYKKIKPIYPTMSFATVYKSVEILNKLNVIQVLNTGEDSFRYDADTSEHSHIQCTVCGRVDDIRPLQVEQLQEEVAKDTDYEVESQQLYFYGICPHCQKKH